MLNSKISGTGNLKRAKLLCANQALLVLIIKQRALRRCGQNVIARASTKWRHLQLNVQIISLYKYDSLFGPNFSSNSISSRLPLPTWHSRDYQATAAIFHPHRTWPSSSPLLQASVPARVQLWLESLPRLTLLLFLLAIPRALRAWLRKSIVAAARQLVSALIFPMQRALRMLSLILGKSLGKMSKQLYAFNQKFERI